MPGLWIFFSFLTSCIAYGHGHVLSFALFLSELSGGVSVLLIRKFREAFKISFSVGAGVSRVVLFTGESRDRLFLLRKKKDKNIFCC